MEGAGGSPPLPYHSGLERRALLELLPARILALLPRSGSALKLSFPLQPLLLEKTKKGSALLPPNQTQLDLSPSPATRWVSLVSHSLCPQPGQSPHCTERASWPNWEGSRQPRKQKHMKNKGSPFIDCLLSFGHLPSGNLSSEWGY